MQISCEVRPLHEINSTTYVVDQGLQDGIEEGDVCAVILPGGSVTGQVTEAGEDQSVVQTKG
jgi:cell shape-determining protein MreC